MNTAIVIMCFGKVDEIKLFLKSMSESDIVGYPKVFIINTDYVNQIKEDPMLEVILPFKRKEDSIFVSKKNLYLSSYRFVLQKYVFPHYDTIIGTESDIWFEKPLHLQSHIKFFQENRETAAISVLVRPFTASIMKMLDNKKFFSFRRYKGYLKIRRGPQPWHLCITKSKYLEQYFQDTNWELSDFEFFSFCQRSLHLNVLSIDCRKNGIHFDTQATKQKYPIFSKIRIPSKLHETKQQRVDENDIYQI